MSGSGQFPEQEQLLPDFETPGVIQCEYLNCDPAGRGQAVDENSAKFKMAGPAVAAGMKQYLYRSGYGVDPA